MVMKLPLSGTDVCLLAIDQLMRREGLGNSVVHLVVEVDGALDADRWRTALADVADLRLPIWGFSSAPLIIGNRLFVNANLAGIALDKNDGRLLWASGRGVCGYATPVPLPTPPMVRPEDIRRRNA